MGNLKKLLRLTLLAILVAIPGAGLPQGLGPECHPVLLYTPDQLPEIRKRVQREPYRGWWEKLLDLSEGLLPADISGMNEAERSINAKYLSFTYVITGDERYALKAVELLEGMRPTSEGGDWGDIHSEVESVPRLCEAYDMLFDYLKGRPEIDSKVRGTISEEADSLYSHTKAWYPFHKNNWQIRQYAALGICAITIADHIGWNRPEDWHSLAKEKLMEALEFQITPDGGFAEGPTYQAYSANIYIPYMIALKNFTGEDLLNSAPVHLSHDWSVRIRLPDGRRPNFDDSHLSYFYGGLLARSHPDGGVHRWDWESAAELYVPPELMPDFICNFDDSIPPEEPDWPPTAFMVEAGDAVFKDSWSRDAVYLLLKGEHGKARVNGRGHEHPDATSFVISAYGKLLAIDSGYIGFDEHSLVNRPGNHNLILVDGKGPPIKEYEGNIIEVGSDAYIEDFFTTDFLDGAEVRTSYEGVNFRRLALFPGKRYFIIADDVDSESGPHTYSYLLHGNGGGSFSMEGEIAGWHLEGAELWACFVSPEDGKLSSGEALHSFNPGEKLTHTFVSYEASGEDLRYLSVLYPAREGEGHPGFRTFSEDGIRGVIVPRDERVTDVIAIRTRPRTEDGTYHLEVSSPQGPLSLSTDAELLLCSFSSGELGYFYIWNGSHLEAGGKAILSASTRLKAALKREGDLVEGYLIGPDSFSISVGPGFRRAIFGGTAVTSDAQGGFSLSGRGGIEIRKAPVSVAGTDVRSPGNFRIVRSFPNPFNSSARISLSIPAGAGLVSLSVYNVLGARVRTISMGNPAPGSHEVTWDGKDGLGSKLPSGVYLCRLECSSGLHCDLKGVVILR